MHPPGVCFSGGWLHLLVHTWPPGSKNLGAHPFGFAQHGLFAPLRKGGSF